MLTVLEFVLFGLLWGIALVVGVAVALLPFMPSLYFAGHLPRPVSCSQARAKRGCCS